MIRRLLAALAATVPVLMCAIVAANTPPTPTVVAVEVVSPHRAIGPQPEQALTDLIGLPLSRARVRESLDRLWALRVFDRVEVEMVPEGDGVRLRYHVSRRPRVERVDWTGDLGLAAADLAASAALAIGGPAEPERLARARADVIARLHREGYLGANVWGGARENPETNGRVVTFVVAAGFEAYVGKVQIDGLARAEEEPLRKALGFSEGDVFRERPYREGLRAFDEELRKQGFFEARMTPRQSTFDPALNRVDVTLEVVEGAKTIVEFVGRDALKESELREKLTFGEAPVLDDIEVRASAEQLAKAYREAGYHFAEVTGTLGGDAVTHHVRFDIKEGPRVTVERIDFDGLTLMPPDKLRDQMQTRPAGLIPWSLRRGTAGRRYAVGPAVSAHSGLRRGGGRAAPHELQRRSDPRANRHSRRRRTAPEGRGGRRHRHQARPAGSGPQGDRVSRRRSLGRNTGRGVAPQDRAALPAPRLPGNDREPDQRGDAGGLPGDVRGAGGPGHAGRPDPGLRSHRDEARHRHARAAVQVRRPAHRRRPGRGPAPPRRHAPLRSRRRRGAGRPRGAVSGRGGHAARGQAVAPRVRRGIRYGRRLSRLCDDRSRQPVRDRPQYRAPRAGEPEGRPNRAAVP